MVDEIDLKIISDLQDDGRKSLTAIGNEIIKEKKDIDGKTLEKKQGISHVSVKKRLNKLVNGEYIKIYAGLNTEKFNFHLALLTVEVESYEIMEEILKKFTNCPRILFLSTLGGGNYNLACILACEDKDTLNIVLAVCSLRNHKGIRRSEVSICDVPILPKFIPLKINNRGCTLENGTREYECKTCIKYKEKKCVGCPASDYYNSNIF